MEYKEFLKNLISTESLTRLKYAVDHCIMTIVLAVIGRGFLVVMDLIYGCNELTTGMCDYAYIHDAYNDCLTCGVIHGFESIVIYAALIMIAIEWIIVLISTRLSFMEGKHK